MTLTTLDRAIAVREQLRLVYTKAATIREEMLPLQKQTDSRWNHFIDLQMSTAHQLCDPEFAVPGCDEVRFRAIQALAAEAGEDSAAWGELSVRLSETALEASQACGRTIEQIRRLDELIALERIVPARPHITQAVKNIVWNRDGGKCANCGSRNRLEYDHIIPVVMGGSSTERNLDCCARSATAGREAP